MTRLLLVLSLLALAACAPTFSARVGDFDAPITNSLGRICWVRVDPGSVPSIRTASYRATAHYDPGALALTDRVRIQVFGRADPPDAECTPRDEAVDAPLSESFELERESSQPIEVGGATYGTELARFVRGGPFWLGASAAGNVGVSDQWVRFRDGRISVGF